MEVTSSTLVCASLANPNRTSTAPLMHNAGFRALGLDYVYVAFEPDDIGKALDAIRALRLPGGSVSTPYKEAVLPYLDEVDPTAKAIGAVNAFKNVDGKLIGYNSDWIGAVGALEEVTGLKNKRVAVLGAGGAARAVVFGLVQRGAEVTIFNRTADKGRILAEDMKVEFGGDLTEVAKYKPEILVNATSIGKDGNGFLQVDEAVFSTATIVMDIVTKPRRTHLLEAAEKHGCTTIEGLRMLVLQGAFTFELVSDHKAPVDVMFDAL